MCTCFSSKRNSHKYIPRKGLNKTDLKIYLHRTVPNELRSRTIVESDKLVKFIFDNS